ncbi:MAG: hypothetical protein C0609_11100 [Deltaproteobacteria bacterium]|nr:MAG: hypothetical protein C0609_11100 [Deltaproteobacteria bacterium]
MQLCALSVSRSSAFMRDGAVAFAALNVNVRRKGETRMKSVSRLLCGALAVGAIAVGSTSATAAGFMLMEQSVSGIGNCFAGAGADAYDASTVYFNPAGMTYLEGSQVAAGFHVIAPTFKFENDGSTHILQDITGQGLTGGNGGNGGITKAAPNLYYVNNDSDLAWGIGVNAPFGNATDYGETWVGRYHGTDSEIITVNINPSVAYKVNEQFSVGGGLNIQYLEATLGSMIDFGTALSALGFTPQGDDGKVSLQADSFGYGWNVGMMFNIDDTSRLGFSYRSKIKHDAEGDADFSVPADVRATLNGMGATDLYVDVDASASITLPAMAVLAYFNQVTPKLALMGNIVWTQWDTMDELVAEFDNDQPDNVTVMEWENSFRYAIGATYSYSERLDLRCGISYEETPIPDAEHRTPRIPDDNRWWVSVGAGYQAGSQLNLDFGLTQIFADSMEIDKSESFADDENDYIRGGLKGDYNSSVTILSAQAVYSF